ncbi:hypothetical protein KPH14_012215 [Odynerus spinipes]|uniref:Globin domain-containing protein n=1 Tax=Odynerus spinipes TaxID=1348599 RepID=A0AAD9VL75_9HYME|nr:hypothetical protein KPH14_012215 [Odynerus spinipes]
MGTFLRFLGFWTNDFKVDEATGLTERQKKLVQNTWAIIKKDQVASGCAVMLAYFKEYPQYQQYFGAFKDVPLNELQNNKRFQAHCASIIATLSSVVDSLHDFGLLEANIITLAERHKKRGQTKEEFQNLKEVIRNVLRQALGKQYTMDVSDAWDKTLNVMFLKIYEIIAS